MVLFCRRSLLTRATLQLFALSGSLVGFNLVGTAADWDRFRGPNGTGISADTESVPASWSPKENVQWKIALPGAGVSSPIVVGDRIFVTCFSGYGVSRDDVGKIEDLKRHLVCVDRTTGKQLWEKVIPAAPGEDPYTGMGIPAHGYASHTPTSDGKNVYVFFGKSGVFAFDMAGNQIWKADVGTGSDDRQWGSASSPILHEELLVVPAGPESRAIVAIDKYTGKQVWKADSDNLGNVWGTPALVKVGDAQELVIGAPSEIWGLNPKNGKLRWYCSFTENDQFSSSVVVDGDTVYAVEGRGGGSVAVKAGGKDDVTNSKVVWQGRDSSRFATPLVHNGRLYFVGNRVFTCVDAKTDEKIYEERLKGTGGENPGPGGPGGRPGAGPGGPGGGPGGFGGGGPGGGGRGGRGGFGGGDYASPVLADGKIYYTARNGETFVVKAGDQFEQLAVNKVTDEQEDFGATPAISKGAIFIRSNKHLYCISESK